MKANQIKKGDVVAIDGESYIVKDLEIKTPSSRSGNTLYKIRFRNLTTKQKYEQTFKGDVQFDELELTRCQVQYLYQEDNAIIFMDKESYEQYAVDQDNIDAELLYLSDATEGVQGLLVDGTLISIELPSAVELEIVDCSPAVKGASATARTKPATLKTGLTVQVPEYISEGEVIRVNTSTGEYISRKT
ncbi:MAG: elongation factor P-like protein YeiP [Gammaproteobacteria bacterium]